MNYLVADVVIRLKNAVLARRKKVVFPYGKMTKAIADVLVREKYLFNIREEEVDGRKAIVGDIAYANRLPLFTDVKIISKPSLRVYAGSKNTLQKGLGMTVVSTNQGVMTGKEAMQKKIGGEVLFKIW